ncbi:hypothetical protein T12_2396 [Trichinella patagoniensis]|uniref:Uncharacterized protein n=1 Tax=Trichinella patagoniensis TaxID=990121 RepID=A0A0V0ZD13_9BILA|nr:hypothetical protein T12_2396 [Trichinella patagoniensis]
MGFYPEPMIMCQFIFQDSLVTAKAIFCPWLRSMKQNAFDCGWSRDKYFYRNCFEYLVKSL